MPRLLFSLVGLFLLAAPANSAPRDLMLVVEESSATVSREQLVSAIDDFIAAQPADARVGIVTFSEAPRLVRPLHATDAPERGSLEQALQSADIPRSEIAGAMERALYELRLNGREDAARVIVLMSDGVIDTGNVLRDDERTRWLRDMLAEDAAVAGIRIFAVALSDAADFQLLQSMVRTANGEYFRASDAAELADALARINAEISNNVAPPERLVFEEPMASVAETVNESAPATERSGPGWRLLLVVLALATLGIVAVVILWGEEFAALVQRRATHSRRKAEELGPKAVLYDVSDTSDIRRYELGARPVVIGRVAGSDTSMDYVVVDERTVGRWHATVERRGQSFWIRDEGSVNGTFVNNQRVTAEHPLKHGDMVRVHRHEFEFVIPELFDSDRTVVSTDVRMAREA